VGYAQEYAQREVSVPNFLADELTHTLAGKEPDDLVFTSSRGRPMSNRNFRRYTFNPAAEDAGLSGSLNPHELRHTAASLMVASGASVKAVSKSLCHASAAMTLDVYAGLFGDELDGVAERLDAAHRQAADHRFATAAPDATIISFPK
jgi:site-specific recombinase XerD